MAWICLVIFFLTIFLSRCASTDVVGVSPNRLPLYDPNKDFTCLDGSKVLSFSSVNDDYCDCPDGSDEPGTSACPNGRFFCENNGYLAELLPSSRVNDGICDCCDASDEYNNEGLCGNNCLELGKEYREQKEREKEIFNEGVALREELSKQGKTKKEQRMSEVAELQKQADEKKELSEKLKVEKENVEALETEAKEKHDKEWEETLNKIKAERNLERANAAFASLDSDESGSITVQELQAATILDKTYNDDEAKELIGGQDSVDKESFVSQLWENKFKDIFNKTKPSEPEQEAEQSEGPPTELPPPVEDKEPPIDEEEDEKDLDSVTGLNEQEDDDDEDDDEEDDEDSVAPPAADPQQADNELPPKPDYDEETKKLIEEADNARKLFDDANREKDDLLNKLADIDRLTKIDMGEHEEFSPLHGQCFEFSDREYTYKLCPFDKASQISKSGGSDVSLGTWGEWSGSPHKYTEMTFTNGLGCWNGPNRSTKVKLSCGTKDELVAVTEPSKCEYEFVFHSPAACHPDYHKHIEL